MDKNEPDSPALCESSFAARCVALRPFLQAGEPYLDWMAAVAPAQQFAVCIADSDAVILLSRGEAELCDRLELHAGCQWSDQVMGMSGLSGALSGDRPCTVVGSEHSRRLLYEIATTAAPFHLHGRTVGAIGVATPIAQGHPALLMLVSRIALDIERDVVASETAKRLALLETAAAEQEQLRLNEERFRSLVESWAQSVWETNAQGEAVVDSPSWRAYTGQTLEEYLGSGWLQAIHPDDRDRLVQGLRRARRSGTPFDIEVRLRHASGEWRWTNERSAPVRAADGSIQKWIGMNIDITAQKKAEEALEQAERRKSDLVSTLAHELRNPLAPIRYAARIAQAPDATDAQRSWAYQVIERQGANMEQLLHVLLEASRVSRGKVELRRQLTNLQHAMQSAIESARPLMESRQHVFVSRLPEQPILVEGDPVRLTQIFANLLTNAAKYTDPHGCITVDVSPQPQTVRICVRDTGIGISADMLPKVFHMFEQSGDALERAEGGLGIGLALVHGLVKLHRGTVEAKSSGLGQGSEFVVHLPLPDSAHH